MCSLKSRAKLSGEAAGEMGREPRLSRPSRVNERLRREELVAHDHFPRGLATRFGPTFRRAHQQKPSAAQATLIQRENWLSLYNSSMRYIVGDILPPHFYQQKAHVSFILDNYTKRAWKNDTG